MAWLEAAATNEGAPLVLMPMVVASFLRLATRPKIFIRSTAEAVASIDALLQCPGVALAPLGTEWIRRQQSCLDKKQRAHALPDACLAAAVTQQGDHLVSFDRDLCKSLGRGKSAASRPAPAA